MPPKKKKKKAFRERPYLRNAQELLSKNKAKDININPLLKKELRQCLRMVPLNNRTLSDQRSQGRERFISIIFVNMAFM